MEGFPQPDYLENLLTLGFWKAARFPRPSPTVASNLSGLLEAGEKEGVITAIMSPFLVRQIKKPRNDFSTLGI